MPDDGPGTDRALRPAHSRAGSLVLSRRSNRRLRSFRAGGLTCIQESFAVLI